MMVMMVMMENNKAGAANHLGLARMLMIVMLMMMVLMEDNKAGWW